MFKNHKFQQPTTKQTKMLKISSQTGSQNGSQNGTQNGDQNWNQIGGVLLVSYSQGPKLGPQNGGQK